MNSDQNLITIENISVDFYFQENFLSKKQKIRAVKNVSLNIKKGSFVGLVGESGSGKTIEIQ
jgi:peptide/nickel transport system ATP-binding protein